MKVKIDAGTIHSVMNADVIHVAQPAPAASNLRRTVLFLAANPAGTARLSLDEEARAISQGLRLAGADLEVIAAWAARPADVLHEILRRRPAVVHFAGHGTSAGELLLVADDGVARPVPADALDALFAAARRHVEVVFLNACYSRIQAERIVRSIAHVIGMRAPVDDRAAGAFAAAFYQALGTGRSVRESFDLARAALLLGGLRSEDVPELLVGDTEGRGTP